jgi:hypothetical protein
MMRLRIALLCGLLLQFTSALQAQSWAILPAGAASTPGGHSSTAPWREIQFPIRVQYLYESTEFAAQGIRYPIVITGARWRAAPTTESWTGGIRSNVELFLSSAATEAQSPSNSFAANRGSDFTRVFQGSVHFRAGSGNGPGVPGPTVVEILFDRPFAFDPTVGRDFLWEVTYPSGTWSGGTVTGCENNLLAAAPGSRIISNDPSAATGGVLTPWVMTIELLYERQGIDEGPLVGLPVTLTARSSTLPLGGRMLQKKSGYEPLADVAPPSGRPDLRHDVVFALGGPPASVEVDAFSLGIDMVLAGPDGRISLPTGAWGALLFSVDGVQGAPTEVIRRELSATDGVTGDIFTYMIPGSSLPPVYANRTTRAMDSTELGLFDPATATRGAVETIDGFAHLYELDADVVATLPSQPTVYFSLAPSTVLAYAAAPFWSGTLPSPGTILQRTWLGTSWGPISVFRAYDQLGLLRQDDIDALAVDQASCKLLFSITTSSPSAPNFSQLRFYGWCLDGGTDYVGDYVTADGTTTVASSMGTGESSTGLGPKTNITSTCQEDPGRGWGLLPSTQGNYLPFTTGQPLLPLPIGIPDRLSSSLFRTCTGAGAPAVMTAMVGWPSPAAVRADGIALFFIYLPGTAPYPILSVARSASPYWSLSGAPLTLEFPLPDTTLLGVEIDGWWIAASLSGELAQSPPVRLAL